MKKLAPLTMETAAKKLRRFNAERMRQIKERSEQAEDRLHKRSQRAKYATGAAESPTPPPRTSAKRDQKILDVLREVEQESTNSSGTFVVEWLAEKFLFEQGLLDKSKETLTHKSTNELRDELLKALERADKRTQTNLNRRINLRTKLQKSPVGVYGWDKSTVLLRSAFISMAMSPSETIPFTCNLSKDVWDRSTAARVSSASHLQSRFQKLLRRSFDHGVPEFWFAIEFGTSGGYHLHGAIECGRDGEAQTKVKRALQTLGGLSNKRAVKLSPAGPRFGWCHYVTKHAAYNDFLLNASWFASTRESARRGKEMYTEFRREVRKLKR